MEDVTKACRDLNKLSKNAKIACEMFLEECEKQGLKVLVTETYRSQARQSYLYEQGRTRPGQIVTQVKKVGYHNTGNAWDICQNIKGKEYSDDSFFEKCGKIAKSLGIEWGGHWTGFVDKPHFQISNNWTPPKNKSTTPMQQEKDEDLFNAVSKIIKSEIKLDFNSWKRKDLISKNIKNVPILLDRLGGLDKMIKDGIISDKTLWEQKKYNVNHVRSLLIKYSLKLK